MIGASIMKELIADSIASPATIHHANDQIKQVKKELDSNQSPMITGDQPV